MPGDWKNKNKIPKRLLTPGKEDNKRGFLKLINAGTKNEELHIMGLVFNFGNFIFPHGRLPKKKKNKEKDKRGRPIKIKKEK